MRQFGRDHLAELSERAGDEGDIRSLGRVLRHGGAGLDRLVVGMGVHEQQSARAGAGHAARITSRRRLGPGGPGLAGSDPMTDTFPRQQARTRNYSLGVPRSFAISPDGQMIAFLRSRTGSDPVTCLWALDLPADESGQPDAASERLLVDPAAIGAARDEPEEERARRERSRERAGGVVAFATDSEFTM